MAITITNLLPDLTMPVVEEINAQTATTVAIEQCQAQAQLDIAQTQLCMGPSAADIEPVEAPCCRTETLTDTPEAGATTERTSCTDGSVTDMITYANGDVCSVVVSKARPRSQLVGYDENGNLCTTDIANACDPNIPVDYFIPLASDFGNQIFCIPGRKYAFAWTGVDAKNLKEQLETFDLDELDDLSLPAGGGDSIRAEVGGVPFSCGIQAPVTFVTQNDSSEVGLDANGNPYYCHVNYFDPITGAGLSWAHTVSDPTLAIEPPTDPLTTVAFNDLAEPIPCDRNLHPLQEAQAFKLDGCYAALGMLCEKVEVEEPSMPEDPTDPSFLDTLTGFLPTLDDCDSDDLIKGKTAQESYYKLWADWWCCEKRSKQQQQYLYWAQLPFAIAGLISSIGTYNDILDKNLGLICRTEEDQALIARCSQELLGTEDEPGLLKICQSNLLEGHNDRIGLINNRGQHACEMAANEIDCYDQMWKPLQQEYANPLASQLYSMLDNGKRTSEYTQSWADGLQDCITENMLPELKRQFGPLLESVGCTSNNLNDWRQDLKQKASHLHDHFNQTYKRPEENMIPVIMDMTTCMVERTCELRDWLYDCARESQDIYRQGYQKSEGAQATAAMGVSAQLIPKIVESVNWLDTNVPYALDIFKTCYGEGQSNLNPALYAEASELAPEITRCFAWFRDNATDYKKFFEECYEDGECRLVKQQLDLACRLATRHEESLERLDAWSIEDREMFTRHFKTHEIRSLQTAATNGHRASRELTQFSRWFDDRTKEYYDTYYQNWMPCDVENLKQHCDIWTRGNPLQELERNNKEMQELSQDLQDFHSNGLVRAKTYMDEVFAAQDRFDFCVEAPAVAYVRSEVSEALDELEKCTSKYASGHLLAARQQLKIGGARAIGAAAEQARRWQWWANEQMTQRDFDRRSNMMQILDSAGIRAIEASKTETAGYDLLLNHANQSLVRGHVYLQSMQESGRQTSAIDQNQVDSMLRAVQLMHFWPELALRENGEFNAQYANMIDDAQNIIQMGHTWTDMASREKTSAVNVMSQSFDVGMRLNQLGQFYYSQAEQMNTQRAQIATQAGQLGNQFANTGHNLHRLASDKVGNALQQSINAAQMGLGAGDLGHKHEALALDIENKMTLNALEHLKAGISAMNLGVDFLGEVRQSYALSGSYGLDAANGILNLFKHGQNSGILGLNANEQCYTMNYQMLCKAKDFMQKNHELNLRVLHGDNVLANSNQLLAQTGDAAGSAFGLLGNSLQGITQNSAPFPFPTGQGAFGFNGGAF